MTSPAHRLRWLVPGLLACGLVVVPGAPAVAQVEAGDQWWHTQWRMDEVWQVTDGAGVTVAVIDTGVDSSIPELAGAVLPGTDFVDPSGDGHTDHDVESVGHGTAMASLIAGTGAGTGVRGVAPGASILPIAQAPESGVLAAVADFAAGIRWAVDHDADVINMSVNVATGECPPVLQEAVRYAVDHDVVVVSGAGNVAGGATGVPAMCPGVLTVGANDPWLEPWTDTHRSAHVDVSAPGYAIPAAGRGGQLSVSPGTSRAAALVSGAVALVRAEFPDASAGEILTRVIATARDIHSDGWDDATGYGLVRPFHALTGTVPPDAPNPVFEALAAAPASPTAPASSAGSPSPSSSLDGDGPAPDGWLLLAAAAALTLAAVAVLLATRRFRAGRTPREG